VGYWAANQWKPQAAEPFEPHPAPLGGSTIRGAHHIPRNNVGSLFDRARDALGVGSPTVTAKKALAALVGLLVAATWAVALVRKRR
jgi:hypothetical protein